MKKFAVSGLLVLVLAACSSTSDTPVATVEDTATTMAEDAYVGEEPSPAAATKSPELMQLEETWDFAASRPGSDICLLYTSPSPRDLSTSRMPSSA